MLTLVRSTRTVGGAGGPDAVVQATRVAATSAVGPTARVTRRIATRSARSAAGAVARVRGCGTTAEVTLRATTSAVVSTATGGSTGDGSVPGAADDGAGVSGTR